MAGSAGALLNLSEIVILRRHAVRQTRVELTSNVEEVIARVGEAMVAWSQDIIAMEAIKHALKALRKRHLIEEGAHGPAFIALSRPLVLQGSEWKEKAETLEVELQQCYKAQSRLSEQLVVEVAESRTSKTLVEEKRSHNYGFAKRAYKSKVMTLRAKNAEAESKTLIDRWMLQKMQDAERLNEANALYEDMLDQLKASGIEQLARQQVDGVVRRIEGAEYSGKLVSGGQDRTIKMWDTNTGSLSRSLYGCTGSVLDLTTTHDNKSVIAASSSNNLYVWDVNSGRMQHTLTGHTDKVCSVDVSKISSRHVVSAAYDHTIKVWDLQQGFCTNTIIFHSNCNALCFSMDGRTICSGHVDGHLRLWDIQTGKILSEVAAHSQAITSIFLSRNGNSRSCISPDDNYVAAGSAAGSVCIWSVSKANIVSTLKEHTASVLCCSWSGLGKPLASSDRSGIICTWT
ncbi:transducin/WD40 repeat-like superfamily protein [Actinidia rufa]|uniref:Transducin/WD40 repeat-like superfamily protein n=1 Tax=Actinidia rufa TaxID=165716 RepID=A0A7J0GAU7_9ERIC|nr:transducin/WD40 repeat-like superfamily protein [Actinidia rufa]